MDNLEIKIMHSLKHFAPPSEDHISPYRVDRMSCKRIDNKQFPVANLLLFLLRGVCKFPSGIIHDKMYWSINFTYKGYKCVIADQKFGLCLYTENTSVVNPKEILDKLEKALLLIEKNYLNVFANEQIKKGNITVSNQFYKLNGQYEYFRDRAIAEYSTVPEVNVEGDELQCLLAGFEERHNQEKKAERQGQYNALAMIDAYFSRLEHIMVLALPFANYHREKDDLNKFVADPWGRKLQRILNFSNQRVKKHHQDLLYIKEKFRNTFAHGGFEKNRQSLSFHLGWAGAIPVSMSGVRESVHFNNISIDKRGFEYICEVFNTFDDYLSNDGIRAAWKYAESGLDLPLEERYLSELLSVVGDDEAYNHKLQYLNYKYDQYLNAEF
ncbi:hypothetical protein [Acinetobacter sp.]|uniref:hypothetical protein n=1 Tax=Acinetobacter sp. TaxID=472 RepID=UPI002FC637AC